MIREDEIKVRKLRGWILNIFTILFFGCLGVYLLSSMRELIFPTILGAVLAYLFRPLFRMGHGSFLKKYTRLVFRLGLITGLIYATAISIGNSLPNEKEELELLVRLQYRLNLRYNEWMGITELKPDGNFIYDAIGQELNPIITKINHLISLNQEQRRLFLQYRNETYGAERVSDKYFEYFLANLKVMQIIEAQDEIKSQMAQANTAAAKNKKSGGLAAIMRAISIWLVFPLTFIFFLLDKGQILHFFMRLIPNKYFELTKNVIDKMDDALGHYIRGTMMECALMGITIFTGFWICGFEINVAILVGIIGGLTNAIPFVGPALACVIGSIFALITEEIHPLLPFINISNLILAVFVVVLIANLLDNAIYQPLVVGSAVNIHPLAVILGVFGGSLSFGFAGLLLAIPVIVILKVVTENLYQGLKAYRII